MSNILSVNSSTPFSATPLDATNASGDELDPRFVEELQGAMGRNEASATPSDEAGESTSAKAESPDLDAQSSLQNLPLMPWALMNVPANFAPLEGVSTGLASDSQQGDGLAALGAVGTSSIDMVPLPVASGGAVASGVADATGAHGDGTNGSLQATSDSTRLALQPVRSGRATDGASISASDALQTPLVELASTTSQDATTSSATLNDTRSTHLEVAAPSTQWVAGQATAPSEMAVQAVVLDGPMTDQGQAATNQLGANLSLPNGVLADANHVSTLTAAASNDQNTVSPISSRVELDVSAQAVMSNAGAGSVQVASTANATQPVATAMESTSTQRGQPSSLVVDNPSTPLAGEESRSSAVLSSADAMRLHTDADARSAVDVVSSTPQEHAEAEVMEVASAPVVATLVQTALASEIASTTQVDAAVAATSTKTANASPSDMRSTDADMALDRAALSPSTIPSMDGLAANVATADAVVLANVNASDATASTTTAEKKDESPDALATASVSAMTGMGARQAAAEHIRGVGAAGEAPAASSAAISTPSSLALSSSSGGMEASGLASTTEGAAESTFASSFVQALMGHVNHPAATHAQVLEVVPSPAPIAPHQVRLDAGQVQVEVVRLVKQGGGQVVMELTPPDESKFKIDLSISQQGVARLVVDGASESTRLRLEQTVSGLQEQFQQMGLQLQLDMRQPQQRDAQPQPAVFAAPESTRDARMSRQDSIEVQATTSRPSWEQGQVYLVA